MPISNADQLPIFPLEVVMFPGQKLGLHVFEEQFVALVYHCLETDEPFGIVCSEDGQLAPIGCAVRIIQIDKEYDDGTMDVVVEGELRFRIQELHQERVYPTARVELYEGIDNLPDPAVRNRVITLHMKLMELLGEHLSPHQYEGARHISYVVAPTSGLDLSGQQTLLERKDEQGRLDQLVDHLKEAIPMVEHRREVARLAMSNGHHPKSNK